MLPWIAESETSWSRFSTPANFSDTMHQFAFTCNVAATAVAEKVLSPLMLFMRRPDLFAAELSLTKPEHRAKVERFAKSVSDYLQAELASPAPFTSAEVRVIDGFVVERKCAACDTRIPPGKSKSQCSGCKLVYYCNKECQNAHWKQHRASCKKGSK
jgi:hypothetical protein